MTRGRCRHRLPTLSWRVADGLVVEVCGDGFHFALGFDGRLDEHALGELARFVQVDYAGTGGVTWLMI